MKRLYSCITLFYQWGFIRQEIIQPIDQYHWIVTHFVSCICCSICFYGSKCKIREAYTLTTCYVSSFTMFFFSLRVRWRCSGGSESSDALCQRAGRQPVPQLEGRQDAAGTDRPHSLEHHSDHCQRVLRARNEFHQQVPFDDFTGPWFSLNSIAILGFSWVSVNWTK